MLGGSGASWSNDVKLARETDASTYLPQAKTVLQIKAQLSTQICCAREYSHQRVLAHLRIPRSRPAVWHLGLGKNSLKFHVEAGKYFSQSILPRGALFVCLTLGLVCVLFLMGNGIFLIILYIYIYYVLPSRLSVSSDRQRPSLS